MAAEDQWFPSHSGFDLKAISRGFDHNGTWHRAPRGASTITQQVAENLFLWPGRGYLRKARIGRFRLQFRL